MDVPYPQELDGIGVMRHPVETRKKQRVHLSECLHRASKMRDTNSARLQLVEAHRVGKQPRAGDLPVKIEVIRGRAGSALHVMPLWFGQLGVTLWRTNPPARGEYLFASIECCPGNQEVDVETRPEMRCRIDRVREPRTFQQQCSEGT